MTERQLCGLDEMVVDERRTRTKAGVTCRSARTRLPRRVIWRRLSSLGASYVFPFIDHHCIMSAPLKKPPAGARLHHTYRGTLRTLVAFALLPRPVRLLSGPPDSPFSILPGHRRDSFVPLDEAEQIELRARQRTFDGAWQRTALGTLGYGAVVLKGE